MKLLAVLVSAALICGSEQMSLESDGFVSTDKSVILKMPGEALNVRCEADGKTNWDFKAGDEENTDDRLPEGVKTSDGEKVLEIGAVDEDHAGTYTCLRVGDTGSIEFKLFVKSKEVVVETVPENSDQTILRVHDPKDKKNPPLNITLSCTNKDKTETPKTWLFNGRPLESARYHKYENGTLYINYATPLDAGLYLCQSTIDDELLTSGIVIQSMGFVKKTHFASKNVMQGGDVKIDCEIFGSPIPTVTWEMLREGQEEPEPVDIEDKRITIGPYKGIENASLSIKNLDFPDRAKYICTANNTDNKVGHKEEILVRVKDKLAALWPFLGIVAEVVILVAIIFFYEKRKAKRDSEEDTSAGEQKRALTDEGVRQRAVKA